MIVLCNKAKYMKFLSIKANELNLSIYKKNSLI